MSYSYAKLDRRHKLKITYRDYTAILRNYEVDFIIETTDKMYLTETKADRDINSPNVAVKTRAAVAWCDQASTVIQPGDFNQPQGWEYLILSESQFKNNRGLSFEGLILLCRGLRENILAQAESRLL